VEIPHAGAVEVVVRNPRLVCFGTGLPTAHVHHGHPAVAGPGPLDYPVEDRTAGSGDRLGQGGRRGWHRFSRGVVVAGAGVA
jgi:hypothetical protein